MNTKHFRYQDMSLLKTKKLHNYGPFEFCKKSEQMLCEFNAVLSFEDDYKAQKSTLDFLDALGLRPTDNGYNYLNYIILYSLKNMEVKNKVKEYYFLCAEKFNVSWKGVDLAIITALKNAAETGKLERMNEIICCECVTDKHISNGNFIKSVCNRFIIAKQFDKEIYINF